MDPRRHSHIMKKALLDACAHYINPEELEAYDCTREELREWLGSLISEARQERIDAAHMLPGRWKLDGSVKA